MGKSSRNHPGNHAAEDIVRHYVATIAAVCESRVTFTWWSLEFLSALRRCLRTYVGFRREPADKSGRARSNRIEVIFAWTSLSDLPGMATKAGEGTKGANRSVQCTLKVVAKQVPHSKQEQRLCRHALLGNASRTDWWA